MIKVNEIKKIKQTINTVH